MPDKERFLGKHREEGNIVTLNRFDSFAQLRDILTSDQSAIAALKLQDDELTAAELAQAMSSALTVGKSKIRSHLTPAGAVQSGQVVLGQGLPKRYWIRRLVPLHNVIDVLPHPVTRGSLLELFPLRFRQYQPAG